MTDHCSWWFEGNWAQCCAIHDDSDQSINAAFDLGRCVAATGHPLIAILMIIGVLYGGWLYRATRRNKK